MRERSVAQNGIAAGVLGATSVAVWFLLTDALRGRPFAVATGLGRNFLDIFGTPQPESPVTAVVIYTIFHYGVFIAVGILAAAVASRSRRDASILAGAFLLFAVAECAFFAYAAFISATEVVGAGGWAQIVVANLVAVSTMGVYLWRAYPHIPHQLNVALSGRE